GPLLRPAQGIATKIQSTSGSSGTPVRFYASAINVQYNAARFLAQYFMEGWDVSLNRTRLLAGPKPGLTVEASPTWVGPLAPLIRGGRNKQIEYLNPDLHALKQELTRDAIGFLVAAPRIVESLAASFDLQFLQDAGTRMWIAMSERVS